MGTVYQVIDPIAALFPASNFPQLFSIQGTNFAVRGLAFDASTEETCYFLIQAISYGSGNLTLRVQWYADNASSGDVIVACAIGCITPNTDTQDIETKSFATAQTATDSHLGTTGQRLHSIDITISNLDSLAADDWLVLKFYRDADAGGDTLANDMILTGLILSYSDT